ncbi:MAG: hypothetical protein ACR2PZ_11760 [Pseudomonadales bacterium]
MSAAPIELLASLPGRHSYLKHLRAEDPVHYTEYFEVRAFYASDLTSALYP